MMMMTIARVGNNVRSELLGLKEYSQLACFFPFSLPPPPHTYTH